MAVAPEHYRAARSAIPRLHLSAILGFTILGVAGSIFLGYTTFNHGLSKRLAAPSNDPQVYAARGVPFDPPQEDPAQRAASIARALTATQAEVHRAQDAGAETRPGISNPILVTESARELRGFSRLATLGGDNSYLAVTGNGFGFGAQAAPVGFMAPDAVTFESSVVPEASTWLYGSALFVLVAARGARARWHRKRERYS